jgi:hypothetical protein
MLDLFSPLAADLQRAQLTAYRHFLAERDGTPNSEMRTLSRREEGMPRFEKQTLSRARAIDHTLFREQYAKFDPKRPTPPEALLLLALVKINAAEAYAVNLVYDDVCRRAVRTQDDMELLVHIEETYHTRILLSSAVLYGLELTEPYKPAASLRAIVGAIAHGPQMIARPLTLAGEIVAALTFLNLLDAARKILKHDPELRDAVEERLIEVLTDEVGHISFSRLLLGPAGLKQARFLLPIVAEGSAHAEPILGVLGMRPSSDGGDMLTTSARLPDSVRRAAFVA